MKEGEKKWSDGGEQENELEEKFWGDRKNKTAKVRGMPMHRLVPGKNELSLAKR